MFLNSTEAHNKNLKHSGMRFHFSVVNKISLDYEVKLLKKLKYYLNFVTRHSMNLNMCHINVFY